MACARSDARLRSPELLALHMPIQYVSERRSSASFTAADPLRELLMTLGARSLADASHGHRGRQQG